jgi:hypothetical protein
MSQLTIYVDEDTIHQIEKTAAREKSSVSRWVKKILCAHLKREWPEKFIKSLGSLKEDDLKAPDPMDFRQDVKRETL